MTVSECKHIGGRAGRYQQVSEEEGGLVTSFFEKDHRLVDKLMDQEAP